MVQLPDESTMRILTKEELYHRCDPDHFSFDTTAELAEIGEMVGQERAVEAVLFGIGIRREGFNLFALGPSGAGKHTLVRGFIADQAAREATPSDWCYINNFTQSTKPLLDRNSHLAEGVSSRKMLTT
jgi:hypothetical protein